MLPMRFPAAFWEAVSVIKHRIYGGFLIGPRFTPKSGHLHLPIRLLRPRGRAG
jgi:hypothetical protein